MTRPKISFAVLAALLAALALGACEREGPAERAGKQVDEAVDNAGDKMEQAGDKAADKLEDAGDKVKDQTQ